MQSDHSSKRSEKGFSLATVLVIGIVCSLWLTALYSTLLPSYQKVSSGRREALLRATAEAAADWAVQDLQAANSQLDPGAKSAVGAFVQQDVPKDVYSSNAGGNASARVVVTNVQPPQSSYLYDPTLDTANSVTNGITVNGWRRVTATSRIGNHVRNIEVLLKPTPPIPNDLIQGPITGDGQGNPNRTAIRIKDGTVTAVDAFGKEVAVPGMADILANGKVNIGKSVINGDLMVSLANPTDKEVVKTNKDAQVTGGVITNGMADNEFDTSGGGKKAKPGVAEAQTGPGGSGTVRKTDYTKAGLSAANPVLEGAETPALTPKTFPPLPDAPASAVDLGVIKINKGTYTLKSGDYIVNKIQIGGNGQLVIDSSSGPVRLYVEGKNPKVKIGGKGILNSDPRGLVIASEGKKVKINDKKQDFSGFIYAPNAKIEVKNTGNFNGAVMGAKVRIDNKKSGNFNFPVAMMGWNPFGPPNPNGAVSGNFTNLKVVSWREF